MSPFPELTQESLTTLREEFSKSVERLDEMPAEINEGFDRVRWVSMATYWALTDTRDEVQEQLKKLIEKIKEAVEGMFAPWLFVDYASKWQQVGSAVGAVYARQNSEEFNLEGNWDGSAYKSFKESRGYQAAAMTAIVTLCESVHDELLTIAEEGRVLYKALIDKLATVISAAVEFAAESASTAGAAVPFALPTANAAITAAVELVVELITNFAEVQTKVWIASNELQNMIRSPSGLSVDAHGNSVWPTPNTREYNDKDDGWELDGED
ncbi:hypothetical protein [Streptomyces anulatus]|uniref:hypothetical protein n=1 Tax=Streptomyces anulatus TaxID=1892 RepID=UPI0036AFA65F